MLEIAEVEQGTGGWRQWRAGMPTASQFSKIVTGTGKPSTQAAGYLNELLAGCYGVFNEGFQGNHWTRRGLELEPEARAVYEFLTDCDVMEIGFVSNGLAGCSPDGAIEVANMLHESFKPFSCAGLEIKCLKASEHVAILRSQKIPSIHKPQVYGSLWLTGWAWWDFFAYHPSMPHYLQRVTADDTEYRAWIKVFLVEIEKFNEKLNKAKQQLGIA